MPSATARQRHSTPPYSWSQRTVFTLYSTRMLVSRLLAGKLIANATPEELRRRYSGGYRVQVDGEPARELLTPALDDAFFAELDPLLAARPGAHVRVETPSMTDVFRRVIAESANARQVQP